MTFDPDLVAPPIPMDSVNGLTQIQPRRSPHIPRSIDNTALDAYMACPRRYFYGMVQNRRRAGMVAPALAFGTTVHKMLEEHYRTGGDRTAVERAIIMSWQQHDRPDDHRTVHRALSLYDEYLRHYGDHEAEARNWGHTVGYPSNPLVEIPVEISWSGALHPYTGKIDRIIEHQGLFIVEDHKTTSALGTYYFEQFDPNNQMMGYAVLAQEATGLPIAGVRINAIGVLKTQTKFAREFVSFSQQRLAEWRDNYNYWISRLEESYHYSNDKPDLACWPHNFNACAGKYGACQYTQVCTSPPHLRQRILESSFDLAPWDPMQVFEEGGADA